MPFLDHLEEMRTRIIRALVAIAAGLGFGFFAVGRWDLLNRLQEPVLPFLRGEHLKFTHPGDPLQVVLSAAMLIGAVVASPVVLYQVWAFLSPALHRHERRAVMAASLGGVVLFCGGALFAYRVVLPMSLPWLFSLAGTALDPNIEAASYLGFVFGMVLTFGLAFELPILILLATAIGLVSPAFLARHRRHAAVLLLVAGAFLTPGDVVATTLALSGPLYLLFEVSILLSRAVHRRRRQADTLLMLLFAPAAFALMRRRGAAAVLLGRTG